MFSINDLITGESRGSVARALEYAKANGANRIAFVEEYLNELWRLSSLVGFDAAILASQSAHETDTWRSHWFTTRGNVCGLGVTGDPAQNAASPTFATGEDAARAQVAHMAAYVYGRLWDRHWPGIADPNWYDPRFQAVFSAGFDGSVRVLSDLGNGRWAVDPNYAAHIAAKANAIFKESPMPTLVAKECPIEIYVNWTGPNRPGLLMPSPSKIVTHEVGNKSPGADEDMHRRFVLNGGGENQVSFHFVVGPTKIVQLLYLDENAWHASDGYTGDGNRDAWGIEHIQLGDFDATLAHGAWLQAELARNPHRFAINNRATFWQDITPANLAERMVRHYDEAPDKKWCPEQIMNRGLWEPYKAAAVTAANVADTPTTPPVPTPSPIWWTPGAIGPQRRASDGAVALAMLGQATAKRRVPVRRDADSKSPVLTTLDPGDKAKIVGTYRGSNRWVFVEVAPGQYGRALWSAFYERFPTT